MKSARRAFFIGVFRRRLCLPHGVFGMCVSCSLPDYSSFSISILAICNWAQYCRVALAQWGDYGTRHHSASTGPKSAWLHRIREGWWWEGLGRTRNQFASAELFNRFNQHQIKWRQFWLEVFCYVFLLFLALIHMGLGRWNCFKNTSKQVFFFFFCSYGE